MKKLFQNVTAFITEPCYTEPNLKRGGVRMVQPRFKGNEYRITTLCVDSYENGVVAAEGFTPTYADSTVQIKNLNRKV